MNEENQLLIMHGSVEFENNWLKVQTFQKKYWSFRGIYIKYLKIRKLKHHNVEPV